MLTDMTTVSLGSGLDHLLGILESSLGSRYCHCQTIEGCSNEVYLIQDTDSGVRYILRLLRNTNFRDYETEKRILAHVTDTGFGPENTYLFADGVLTQYIEGNCIGDDTLLGAMPYYELIACQMRRLHGISVQEATDTDTQRNQLYGLRHFIQIAVDDLGSCVEADLLRTVYSRTGALGQTVQAHPELLWVCISHNDLHAGNILYCAATNQVRFIDWEYSRFNLNVFDIVCFFLEFTGIECAIDRFPSKEQRREFYRRYFGDASDVVDSVCMLFVPLVCYFWAAWAKTLAGLETYAQNRRRLGRTVLRELARVLQLYSNRKEIQQFMCTADCGVPSIIDFSFEKEAFKG